MDKLYDLLDGCALLEISGDLYGFVWYKGDMAIFQDINSDHYFMVKLHQIKYVYPNYQIIY